MNKILLLDKVAKAAADLLHEHADFEIDMQNNLTREQKLSIIDQYQAIVIRSATFFDKNFIDKASNLKLIVRAGEGTDKIDKKAVSFSSYCCQYSRSSNQLCCDCG